MLSIRDLWIFLRLKLLSVVLGVAMATVKSLRAPVHARNTLENLHVNVPKSSKAIVSIEDHRHYYSANFSEFITLNRGLALGGGVNRKS